MSSVEAPNPLTGRMAHCFCGSVTPSSWALAFFEFLGEGSKAATESCAHCGYALSAHGPDAPVWRNGKTAVMNHGCPGFEPRGDVGHDRYYCGCRGWD